ncbi:hypothetical protein A4G99_16700 [Haladaptatus sp. R4]|nr:hypothetical protein A4G99_16700 [Haladaptatus sp. R4]
MSVLTSSLTDQRTRLQTVLITLGLFVCSAGFLVVVKRFDLPVFQFLRLEYLAVGLLTDCAVLAVQDQSLRRVWLFTLALAAGFGIHLAGMGIGGEMLGLTFRILWTIIVGAVVAAVLETLGGLLGLCLFRVSTAVR